MVQKDSTQIKHEFWKRQGRQFIAIAAALFLVLLPAVAFKRSDLFGEYSKNTLALFQLAVIASFIVFTSFNWRCPACKKHLGNNIVRRVCKNCSTRLR